MLVEFLGWPGSGKSTIARALRQSITEWRLISNWTRRVWAAAALLPNSDVESARQISKICSRYARPPVALWRRTALLRGDRAIALAAQNTGRFRIADELFLHTLFGTVGPRDSVPDELLQAIGTLVEGAYRRGSVAFIYLCPPADAWEKRLLGRAAGRSRFGSGGDERLLKELKRDRLLDAGIVSLLKESGFHVVDVSAENPDIARVVSDCRLSIERYFRR